MHFIRASQLALLFIISMGPTANGQDNLFDGDWRGKVIMAKTGKEIILRIRIDGVKADNYYCENGTWISFGVESRQFLVENNNAMLRWIHRGGVWTETQVFSLSYVNYNTLDFVWIRHVNNTQEIGDYDTWHTFGHGTFRRSTDPRSNCTLTSWPPPNPSSAD